MRSIRVAGGVVLTLALLCGSVRPAQAQQTLNFTLGGFVPFGQDGRVDQDVLVRNHEYLAFNFKDFTGMTAGGEWLVPLGHFLEVGAGVSFYRRTVPTVYRDYVASDRTEIEQNLRLRMIPIAFTARFVPTGQSSPIQPYFGAGMALIDWRYSEYGDFVDFSSPNLPVRQGSYVAEGLEVGPVALGGIRFVSDTISVGGEVRYQQATGDLDNRFAKPRLDLGGWTYQATFGWRFGR